MWVTLLKAQSPIQDVDLRPHSTLMKTKAQGSCVSPKSPMAPDDIEDKMRVPFDGPITRARAKMIHGATQALLIRIGATLEVGLRPTWVTLLQAQTTAQDLNLRPIQA